MSLNERARGLIEQAGVAIQSGNPQYATELLRQSIVYNGKDPEAYVLLGIALAQTGMSADALNAFRKATRLGPEHVKAHYNLAVHLYTEGQLQAALESARAAASIDALHSGSRTLVERIEAELGIEPGDQPKTTIAGSPAEYRSGYEPADIHAVPFIDRVGPAWPWIGWGLAALSLATAAIFAALVFPYMSSHQTGMDEAIRALGSNPGIAAIRIGYFTVNIGGLGFIALDAIHRRGNLLWLLPQAFCGCTGFTFVVVPLYMILGRKKEGNAEAPSAVNQ